MIQKINTSEKETEDEKYTPSIKADSETDNEENKEEFEIQEEIFQEDHFSAEEYAREVYYITTQLQRDPNYTITVNSIRLPLTTNDYYFEMNRRFQNDEYKSEEEKEG